MSKYFTKPFHVGWDEIDANGQVRLASYFQYVVETAWAWGAANGLGAAESEGLGLAWVIHETELSLFRPLGPEDEFTFTIWLKDWRRVRGTRCFEIRLHDTDELIAEGAQEIVVLDSRTFRPKAPPQDLIDNLRGENPRAIPQQAFPKVLPGGSGAFITQRTVEWRDLDWQEHVNNAVYAEYADEAAMQALAALGWSPADMNGAGYAVRNRRVHIQYPSSAVWGEQLEISTSLIGLQPAGGAWYVSMLRHTDHEPVARCVLEWSTVDRGTGEEKPMPDTLLVALQERLITLDGAEA